MKDCKEEISLRKNEKAEASNAMKLANQHHDLCTGDALDIAKREKKYYKDLIKTKSTFKEDEI